MVGLRGVVSERVVDSSNGSDSLLRVFSSPSTLPHILALGIFSGFLFVAMKIDLFGSEMQGSIIFLSLSITYFFAALISPSRVGKWIFTLQNAEEGVLKRSYWLSGFSRLVPIIAIAGTIWVLANSALGDNQLGNARVFLALLFIGMSVFQGVSIGYGWVVYGKKIQRKPRKSKVGGVFPFLRSTVSVVVFAPLVWWFGFGAENPNNAGISKIIFWSIFLLMIVFLCVFLDRYTKNSREGEGVDGVALDRVFFFIFITSCWHLMGAWRRSPFASGQSSGGMLVEEGVLMSISIIFAVWSMSKRGEKGGLSIFQGQSAVFWGIGFGFIYAGSISSLTALSEGSLLTTTAIGHAITALVMLGMLPMFISWTGKPDIDEQEKQQSSEGADDSYHAPEVEKFDQIRASMEDDAVELLD